MNLNEVDIHYLIAAISVITSALVFYTIGVWGERLQKRLKFWHLVFFLLGLLADSVGTALMENIARLTPFHIRPDSPHSVNKHQQDSDNTGHSIVVWCIWLIPYCIGVYLGMSLHH